MPTFGEYETVAEPLATTEEPSHVTTVWKAKHTQAGDGRLFAIKFYSPRSQPSARTSTEDGLERDLALEFLAGIKQLRKASQEDGKCLMPIHAFGLLPTGAWYVTDYSERRSLKEYITRQGRVNDQSLRHIVHSVVTGCLSLKRSRETRLAHGNLKPSNVLLTGGPQALRATPLRLADPYPAAPLQLPEMDPSSPVAVTAPLVELRDLRAIGELLLQLVEGRLVRSGQYNHPVSYTEKWRILGRKGEFWHSLCNRLLDPKLSLETENLEKLEQDFRPSAVFVRLHHALSATGVVCRERLIKAGEWCQGAQKRWRDRRARAATTEGGEAKAAAPWKARAARARETATRLGSSCWDNLKTGCAWALQVSRRLAGAGWDLIKKFKRSEVLPKLQKLSVLAGIVCLVAAGIHFGIKSAKSRADANRRRSEAVYQSATNEAWDAFKGGEFQRVVAAANKARSVHPDDLEMEKLIRDAQEKMDQASQLEEKFQGEQNAARNAYKAGNNLEAIARATAALKIHPDKELEKLKTDAQAKMDQAARLEEKFQGERNAARNAYNAGNNPEAIARATEALKIHPDKELEKLKTDAQAKMDQAARLEKKFQGERDAARSAYNTGNNREAIARASEALKIHSDKELEKLKSDAQARMDQATRLEEKFQGESEAARSAYNTGNNLEAIARASEALKIHPDKELEKLKSDAQKRIDELADTETRYQFATNAALKAWSKDNYTDAADWANKALKIHREDEAMLRLSREAQEASKRREQKYQTEARLAAAAWDRRDYVGVTNHATLALNIHPGDEATAALRKQAQEQIDNAARLEEMFQGKSGAARAAFDSGNNAEAISQATEALKIRADKNMEKLRNDAQKRIDELADTETRYQFATNAALKAWSKDNYTDAADWANKALKIHGEDQAMLRLSKEAREAIGRLDQRYQGETNSAGTAWKKGDYEGVTNHAAKALQIHPDDRAMDALRINALKMIEQAARIARHKVETNTAWTALATGKYSEALAAVDRALLELPGDRATLDLEARIQKDKAAQEAPRETNRVMAVTSTIPDTTPVVSNPVSPPADPDAAKPRTQAAVMPAGAEDKVATGLKAAQEALRDRKLDEAMSLVDAVLAEKRNDETAKDLQDQITYERIYDYWLRQPDGGGSLKAAKNNLEKRGPYQRFLRTAREDLKAGHPDMALRSIQRALNVKPWDQTALDLKKQIESLINSQTAGSGAKQ